MDATARHSAGAANPVAEPDATVYRHSVTTRITHWLTALSLLVLVMSGLQIFNAASFLDASDKTNPAHRVLSIDGGQTQSGANIGTVTIFGHTLTTTHVLGYTDDGMGGETERAFPGWITLPGYQSLADGRRWHLFFSWILVLCGAAYLVVGFARGDIQKLVLRPADIPKLLPMQLYYLRLRKNPPPYGKYNPLQKMAYTLVLFAFVPLIILTGLALSPGVDAWLGPLPWLLGGRQFARLWHFLLMLVLLSFVAVHVVLVLSTGVVNNMRSMITGRYRLGKHEGLDA
jgi:thiosulfate reductase cytochrome b subunit